MWAIFARNRILIIIAFTLISSLYAVYSISLQRGLNSLEEVAGRNLEHIANALFVPVDKYSYLPEVIASQPIIINALLDVDSPASIKRANAYLQNINQIVQVEAIYLLEQSGSTVAASNWNSASSFVGNNYAFRPYFHDAIQGEIGRFYAVDKTSKTPGYYLSHPVMNNEEIIGVVAVKIDLSDFDHQWRKNYAYEVTVADEHGVNFLSSMPDWKYRPMQELEAAALRQLRRTQRYDGSLKPPLPVLNHQIRDENSRYLTISVPDDSGQGVSDQSYVVRTGRLSWSAWTLNIFMPADKVHAAAIRHTLVAGALISLLALGLLYWNEARRRAAERDKAKMAIEAAHAELEEKHRHLEVVSMELTRLASVDDLTGSYNRRFFFEIAAKMLSSVHRHKLPLSVIVIDVDFFKHINDKYGHHVGDNVLRQIAQICSSDLREEDIFARLGGEEFVLALMPTTQKDAMDVADRLRVKVMDHPFMEDGSALNVTISCGVAQFHPSDQHIEETIKRADKALYEAKKSGRNQIAAATIAAN